MIHSPPSLVANPSLSHRAVSRRCFRVGRAKTGLGLFATRTIKNGEYIATYRGRRLTTAQAEEREARGARYMFEINSKVTIDGSSRSNLARYVNHSCDPNARAIIREKKLIYIAQERIEPDTEITVDYGKDYFAAFIKDKGCRCQACARKARKRRQRAAKKRLAKSMLRRPRPRKRPARRRAATASRRG